MVWDQWFIFDNKLCTEYVAGNRTDVNHEEKTREKYVSSASQPTLHRGRGIIRIGTFSKNEIKLDYVSVQHNVYTGFCYYVHYYIGVGWY